ncbi:MAG: hypothetical protein WCK86_09675 [Planctomycetia bacterium]
MIRSTLILQTTLLALLLFPAQNYADTLQLPVTKDNSIVMVDGEWTQNVGRQGRIRIKGNQHIVAMSFDTSAIAGRRVTKATLVCEQADQMISHVTISTIATPWDETRSNGLTCGIDTIQDWGYAGARFPAVCGGNGHTLVHQAESTLVDGRYHWSVAPDLIHAMAIGVAHGLAIHEHDADYGRNPTIYSNDQSGRKPWLLVEVDDVREPLPVTATDLKLEQVGMSSAELSFVVPEAGFAYEVFVAGIPVGRHNIPLVTQALPGSRQSITLRDLPEDLAKNMAHEISIVTINRAGQKSQPAILRDTVFRTTAFSEREIPVAPVQKTLQGISVIPVTDKYDADGKPVGDLAENYRNRNTLFDGQQVQLIAAAGEVVGIQLLLRGASSSTLNLAFDQHLRTELWQGVYVPAGDRSIVDPLLPLTQPIALQPDSDAVIIADIFVPFDAPSGVRKGVLTISDGRRIPIALTVLPFALPRQATFFCEMNGYGLPDHVNDYYQLQQIAYDHRVHSNILHYSHNTAAPGSRKSNMDMRLQSGRRMDNRRYDGIEPGAKSAWWNDFSEAFGPCFDGSLFANGHRGPVAVPGFYLTFHESWPLNCRQYFNGNPDAFTAFRDTPVYSETFENILGDFVQLARTRGWNQTRFQVYLNNKGSLNDPAKAPWILDEPSGFWDYRALRYYGELTDHGRADSGNVHIDYRIDISRPEFTRGQLDRRSDLWVVSSWAFQHYRRLVTDRIRRDGLTAWVYGTSNHVHETNRNIQAWALDARRFGASGLVPWQTVNKDGTALKQADQLGLFIFDQDKEGRTVIRHSLRLKAWRDAQQLIEYLNLLQKKRSWSDDQLRGFIGQYVQLDSEVRKSNDDDAGTTAYGRISPLDIESLRQATAGMILQP